MNFLQNYSQENKIAFEINRILKLKEYYATKKAESILEYESNPKICPVCMRGISYGKRNRINYCSRKCSAKSPNNINKKRKPKKIKINYPKSKLYICKCLHCNFKGSYRRSVKYCPKCKHKYSSEGRAAFEFGFNVFNFPDLFDLDWLKRVGFRNNINVNGLTRDHKLSVQEAIRNDYDPYYIRHPINCELMTFNGNVLKRTKSSISYEELKRQVDEYDNTKSTPSQSFALQRLLSYLRNRFRNDSGSGRQNE